MRQLNAVFLILFSVLPTFAQDSLYTRKTIKFLTSKACYGRGYLRDGLNTAASYIAKELKTLQVQPLQSENYFQPFRFNVNTFPGKVSVKINGQALRPGEDYIMSPESAGLKGKFTLQKKDSVTYTSNAGTRPLVMRLRKKLTFSVATEEADYCEVELLDRGNYPDIKTAEVNIRNKMIRPFEAKNIIGFLPGQHLSDSMIVFAAHYDHLGGMGKKTFFPGANDNASGVSVLLNLAKYYTAHPPRYKTLFIFFAGEEAGLIGSKFFTESGLIDLKKIKFLVNLDLLGTGDDGIMVVNGALHEKEFALLQKINAEQQLVKEVKKRGKAKNSDHYWFSEAGVHCFFIYTLGGTTSYHDVFDVEKKLPLTDYKDVFRLITTFVDKL
jgi:aminopeptidase YwaD